MAFCGAVHRLIPVMALPPRMGSPRLCSLAAAAAATATAAPPPPPPTTDVLYVHTCLRGTRPHPRACCVHPLTSRFPPSPSLRVGGGGPAVHPTAHVASGGGGL
ncbi:hypothetical protein I4F81_007748 [Pyropia yezoensis]|uniref:Uncharacterized protein n=1 Tax=Pyropia yezoensis TaxID=2788 RepID=A0ACC3C520_PYRYE|nr:hypothetical protein I4F81_007748 [Neopyropia yezoensis]